MNQPKLRFKNNDGNSFNDWKKYKLNKIGTHYNGLSGKTKDDFGEGVPYISYLDIFEKTVIDFIPESLVKVNSNEKQNVVKKGDIFFTISSETPEEVGIASVYNGQDTELYLNSFSFGFRPNNYDPENSIFLSYFFRSPAFRKVLNKLAQGSTRFNLSKTKLLESVINIPSDIKERKKIADFLSTVDRRIDLQRQLVDETRRLKTSVSQMLFSQKVRFKDDDGTEFPEWEETELKNLTEIKTGNLNAEDAITGGKYPFYDRSEEIKTLDEYSFDEEAIIYPGEGSSFFPKYYKGKFALHQRAYAIMNFKNINPLYLFQFLFTKNKHFLRTAVGTTVKSLRMECFNSCVIMFPKSAKEQEKIADTLCSIDSKISLLEEKLKSLENLKKGLLQQMFV